MSKDKKINRREALKYIGTTAVGVGLGISGGSALSGLGSIFQGRTMRVLLVNGNPNKEGCTFTALSEIAKSLNEYGVETEIFLDW